MKLKTFHMYCIIPHVLAATNMKWIEAKMKVSVRNKLFHNALKSHLTDHRF